MLNQTKIPMELLERPRENFVLCLASDDFHKVRYTDWGNPASQKIAICAHGVSRNGRDFDYLARALASEGYRVICPDMPGRGKSDWLPITTDYNLPFLANILTNFINLYPGEELLWVGTSMGGILGMLLASRSNTPIKKLILNDIGSHLDSEPLKKILQYLSIMPTFKTRNLAKSFLSQILTPFGIKTDEHLDHLTTYSFFINDQGEYQLTYDPKILTLFQTDEADLSPFWDPISCATLVIRGQNSAILTDQTAIKMATKPNVELVEFPNVAHAPALMDEAQITTIINWIKK